MGDFSIIVPYTIKIYFNGKLVEEKKDEFSFNFNELFQT